jgi:hypothetical protein
VPVWADSSHQGVGKDYFVVQVVSGLRLPGVLYLNK